MHQVLNPPQSPGSWLKWTLLLPGLEPRHTVSSASESCPTSVLCKLHLPLQLSAQMSLLRERPSPTQGKVSLPTALSFLLGSSFQAPLVTLLSWPTHPRILLRYSYIYNLSSVSVSSPPHQTQVLGGRAGTQSSAPKAPGGQWPLPYLQCLQSVWHTAGYGVNG